LCKFKKLSTSDLTKSQLTSAEIALSSKDLYCLDKSQENIDFCKSELRKSFINIASVKTKDKTAQIIMCIHNRNKKRAILMKTKDKEFFIVCSRWLDVL
jgi:lipopolysaccharide export LptBFGC system permease protein LptF